MTSFESQLQNDNNFVHHHQNISDPSLLAYDNLSECESELHIPAPPKVDFVSIATLTDNSYCIKTKQKKQKQHNFLSNRSTRFSCLLLKQYVFQKFLRYYQHRKIIYQRHSRRAFKFRQYVLHLRCILAWSNLVVTKKLVLKQNSLFRLDDANNRKCNYNEQAMLLIRLCWNNWKIHSIPNCRILKNHFQRWKKKIKASCAVKTNPEIILFTENQSKQHNNQDVQFQKNHSIKENNVHHIMFQYFSNWKIASHTSTVRKKYRRSLQRRTLRRWREIVNVFGALDCEVLKQKYHMILKRSFHRFRINSKHQLRERLMLFSLISITERFLLRSSFSIWDFILTQSKALDYFCQTWFRLKAKIFFSQFRMIDYCKKKEVKVLSIAIHHWKTYHRDTSSMDLQRENAAIRHCDYRTRSMFFNRWKQALVHVQFSSPKGTLSGEHHQNILDKPKPKTSLLRPKLNYQNLFQEDFFDKNRTTSRRNLDITDTAWKSTLSENSYSENFLRGTMSGKHFQDIPSQPKSKTSLEESRNMTLNPTTPNIFHYKSFNKMRNLSTDDADLSDSKWKSSLSEDSFSKKNLNERTNVFYDSEIPLSIRKNHYNLDKKYFSGKEKNTTVPDSEKNGSRRFLDSCSYAINKNRYHAYKKPNNHVVNDIYAPAERDDWCQKARVPTWILNELDQRIQESRKRKIFYDEPNRFSILQDSCKMNDFDSTKVNEKYLTSQYRHIFQPVRHLNFSRDDPESIPTLTTLNSSEGNQRTLSNFKSEESVRTHRLSRSSDSSTDQNVMSLSFDVAPISEFSTDSNLYFDDQNISYPSHDNVKNLVKNMMDDIVTEVMKREGSRNYSNAIETYIIAVSISNEVRRTLQYVIDIVESNLWQRPVSLRKNCTVSFDFLPNFNNNFVEEFDENNSIPLTLFEENNKPMTIQHQEKASISSEKSDSYPNRGARENQTDYLHAKDIVNGETHKVTHQNIHPVTRDTIECLLKSLQQLKKDKERKKRTMNKIDYIRWITETRPEIIAINKNIEDLLRYTRDRERKEDFLNHVVS